jgi:hypothetical protein
MPPSSFLHVRVLAGGAFVVWVPGSVSPSLFEMLPDVLQRADHDAEILEVIEPLFGDGGTPQRNVLKPRCIFSCM